MIRRSLHIILGLFITLPIFAQNDSTNSKYHFILQDTPSKLFSMRQSNTDYISLYRILTKELNNKIKKRPVSELIQLGLVGVFFLPLTHEEGHRSILTRNNIGSISQPFFNSKGAAYVIGVTDQTLIDLRDKNLPGYIRLHTGGLESDYLLTQHAEDISIFGLDDYSNLKIEYALRKFSILQYFITGLFEYEIDLKEEPNELERDIVGYDTYGAARHLFRPNMPFHRYTRYDELNGNEKDFIKRIGSRSFLNLLNPLLIGKTNFQISESLKMNFGMGYTLAPFGDFIDENIWMQFNNGINVKVYFRQFQNRSNWFQAGGIGIYDFGVTKNIWLDSRFHFWNQPENLDFNTSQGFTGGAFELTMKYFFLSKDQTNYKGTSIDVGTTIKTDGFLPEEVFLNEHIGFRIGTTIWF